MSQPIVPIFVPQPDDPFVIPGNLLVQGDEVVDGDLLVKGVLTANHGGTPGSGTVTSITAGTGLTGGTITSAGTIAIDTTGVTAASYTSTNLTVNARGQITAASNGSGGGTVTSIIAGNQLTGGTITGSGTIAVTTTPSFTSLILTGGIGTATNNIGQALKAMFNGLLYPELQNTLTGAGTVASPYTFTDNTAGLQACFTALSTAQSGQIMLSCSQYNTTVPIDPITNISNQSIRGVSMGYQTGPLKTWQPTTGSRIMGTLASGPIVVVHINPALVFEKLAMGFPVASFTCQQGPWVSYASNTSVSSGIVWTGTSGTGGGTDQGLIRDCTFFNCMAAVEVAAFGNWDVMTVDHINTDGCVSGVVINAPVFYSRVYNSIFADMPYWGVFSNAGAGTQGTSVNNCTFTRLVGTSNTDIDTLGLGGNTARGMVIDSAIYGRITNNTFNNPGTWIFTTSGSGSTTYQGKMQLAWCIILNQSQSPVVTGNDFYMSGFGQANSNCINIINNTTQAVITGNTINAFSQGIINATNCSYGTISGNTFQFQNYDITLNASYWVVTGNSFQNTGAANGLAVSNPCSITINGNHNVIGPNTYLSGVGGQPDIIINAGATGNTVFLVPGMIIVDNGTGTVLLNYALVTATLVTLTGTDASRVITSV